jgi:hypothetical protein
VWDHIQPLGVDRRLPSVPSVKRMKRQDEREEGEGEESGPGARGRPARRPGSAEGREPENPGPGHVDVLA